MVHTLFSISSSVLLICALTSCVPMTDQPYKEVDPHEVVQKQIELGTGYLQIGDYYRARENLNKALEISPRSGLAHTTLGVLFQLEGENELAEEHFRKAIRYTPALSRARNNYGVFLFARKRYPESIEQLSVAAEDLSYRARSVVFENLGRAYLKVNEQDSAEHAFVRATELNPEQARALLELADIRFHQQNYEAAWDLYQQHARVSRQSARGLLLCEQLAERLSSQNEEASCGVGRPPRWEYD